MGDFNNPSICWKDDTAGDKQSRRCLDGVDDNFLLEEIRGTKEERDYAGPCPHQQEVSCGKCDASGQPWLHGHGMLEFEILRAKRRVCSKLTILDFRTADFGLYMDMLADVP